MIAFVGKGGVGKTSISSALALHLSRHGKTAIVSSDFMSSLRHVFHDNHEGLKVIEMKEKEVAVAWKARYGSEVNTVLRQFFKVDPWILDHIAESPGVAEEFMISSVVDLDNSGEYDYVVWDTAASSSTMHLLMLEKEFYEHLDRDVMLFLKLRDRFHAEKVLDLLEEWKSLSREVWRKLEETAFFLVTTQDELSLLQAIEIREDFARMGLNLRGTICNRCKESAEGEFALKVPEYHGTAREIVEQISRSPMESLLQRLELHHA